jgi:hypothetical protein
MSGVSLQGKIELSGNFFTHDPGKTLYRNIGDMLEALSDELETSVSGAIRGYPLPQSVGWTADHVVGYVISPTTGKHWALWAAVGLPTTGMDRATAIRTKAAGASIERRFHPFRQAKSAVYRSRALISADLAKGLE